MLMATHPRCERHCVWGGASVVACTTNRGADPRPWNKESLVFLWLLVPRRTHERTEGVVPGPKALMACLHAPVSPCVGCESQCLLMPSVGVGTAAGVETASSRSGSCRALGLKAAPRERSGFVVLPPE